MSDNSNNDQALKNTLDSLAIEIKQLKLKIEESKQQDKNKEKETTSTKFENWIKNLSMLLGIPGIIVALLFQINQAKGSDAQVEKTRAETEQIRLNTLKQKTEFILDTLINNKTKNIEEYKTLINKELPKLNQTILQLEQATIRQQNQNLFFKYIILWIVFIGIGFFTGIVSTFWSSLLNVSRQLIYQRLRSVNSKRQQKFFNAAEISMNFLSPLPTIIDLFLRLSLFIALLIPLFNETALLLGATTDFSQVFDKIKNWQFSQAVQELKTILF